MSKETKSLTIERIMNSLEALREISNEDIPLKAAVRITRTIKEVDNVLEVFNDSKKKLFEKYGEEVEGQEGSRIKEENVEVFNEKYIELLKQEVDIDFVEVDVEDLGDINVKPSVLMTLDWFISL